MRTTATNSVLAKMAVPFSASIPIAIGMVKIATFLVIGTPVMVSKLFLTII